MVIDVGWTLKFQEQLLRLENFLWVLVNPVTEEHYKVYVIFY